MKRFLLLAALLTVPMVHSEDVPQIETVLQAEVESPSKDIQEKHDTSDASLMAFSHCLTMLNVGVGVKTIELLFVPLETEIKVVLAGGGSLLFYLIQKFNDKSIIGNISTKERANLTKKVNSVLFQNTASIVSLFKIFGAISYMQMSEFQRRL